MSDEVPYNEAMRDSGEGVEPARDRWEAVPSEREESGQRLPAKRFSLLDPDYRRPKIIFQPRILAFLVLFALVAFAAIGFLGYPSDDANGSQFYLISHPAWVLFGWFGAIALIVQWTIFGRQHDETDRRVLRWRWAVTIITIVCMAIEAVIYAQPRLLREASSGNGLVGSILGDGRLLWNLANFAIIAVYAVDRVLEWRKRLRAEHGIMADGSGMPYAEATRFFGMSLPNLELLSQDIFAGAALCFLLGLTLQTTPLNFALRFIPGRHVDTCTLSWVFGVCQGGSGSSNAPTLHTIDWIGAGSLVSVSLLVLVVVLLVRILYLVRDKNIVIAVAEGVWAMIKSLPALIIVFIPNLRAVIWPTLIAAGTTLVGISARLLQMYLHALSDQRTCGATGKCPDLSEFSLFLRSTDTQLFQSNAYLYSVEILALALALGIVGAFFILLAVRVLLLYRVDGAIWSNWLRFVVVTAFIVVCTFWIMSLTLSAINGVLSLAEKTPRAPFPQPGTSTIASLIIFAVALIVIQLRRSRLQAAP
jgi:hypothetical protein